MFILLFSSVAVTFAAEPLRNPSGDIAKFPREFKGEIIKDDDSSGDPTVQLSFFDRLLKSLRLRYTIINNNLCSAYVSSSGQRSGTSSLYFSVNDHNAMAIQLFDITSGGRVRVDCSWAGNKCHTPEGYGGVPNEIQLVRGEYFTWSRLDPSHTYLWDLYYCDSPQGDPCLQCGAFNPVGCGQGGCASNELLSRRTCPSNCNAPKEACILGGVESFRCGTTTTTQPGATTTIPGQTTTTIIPTGQPYIQDLGKCTESPWDCIKYDSNTKKVIGTFRIKNVGESMTQPWILEMQYVPMPKYEFTPMAILDVGLQQTCDSAHPENVHRTFQLAKNEEATIELSTYPKDTSDAYKIWGIIETACARSGGEFKINNAWISDWKDGGDVGTIREGQIISDKCTKAVGQSCTPINQAGTDDSGPSDECASGWCRDMTGYGGGGGRCAVVGTMNDGSKMKGAEPHPTCVELGTVKKGFDFAWFGEDSLINGIPNWIIIAGGFFILLIISKMFGGGK